MAHHDPIGLIAPNAGLAQLNERSRDIFRQIVESYLATGEPVGSRNISRLIAVPLSPASVRNVMAGSRAARPDLRAAYLGGPAADRTRLAVLRRRPDAGRRSHRSGAAVDPDPACLRRPGAIGRGRARRGADAAVRPDPGGRGGADREIQFAAETYRIRAAGAGAGAGGAGRRGRPGREPRADAAAGRSLLGADRSHQFSQCADQGTNAGGSAARTRNRIDAKPRRTRSADAEGDRRGDRELVRRRKRRPPADRARPRQSAGRSACAGRPRAGPAVVRRSRDQARRDRSVGPRRARRGRADFHRIGEQAVFAVRLFHHHRAL